LIVKARNIGFILLSLFFVHKSFADSNLDSLWQVYNNAEIDTVKADALIEIGLAYRNINLDSAYLLSRQAFDLSSQINYRKGMMYALFDAGGTKRKFGEYRRALDLYDSSMDIARKLKREDIIGKLYNDIGIVYEKVANFPEAINSYKKSLDIMTQLQDTLRVGFAYLNLGIVYMYDKNYELAKSYHSTALEIFEDHEYKKGIAFVYNNLGVIADELKQYDSALYLHTRSYQIKDELQEIHSKATSLSNLAQVLEKLNRTEEAFKEITHAIEIIEKLNDPHQQSQNYLVLANLYLKKEQPGEAIKYLKKILEFSNATNTFATSSDAYRLLSQAYKQKNDYVKALEAYKNHKSANDSIYNKEKQQEISFLQIEFEAQKVENENKLLKKEKESQASIINKQRMLVIAYSIILLLVLSLIGILYNSNAAKSRMNKLIQQTKLKVEERNFELERLNNEISLKNNAVANQNLELKHINNVKDKLISIISHDFRSPLSSLKGFVQLINENEIDHEQIKELARHLSEQVNNTSSLLDNLLLWTKTQLKGMAIEFATFSIAEIIEENIMLFKAQIELKELEIDNQVSCSIKICADKEMIKLILRNILSNAIKFSHKNSCITISQSESENDIAISISDTGVGMDEGTIKNLFSGSVTTTLGTFREKGTGLGLVLCKDFIEMNNGKIKIDSALNTGTTITFCIPKSNMIKFSHN